MKDQLKICGLLAILTGATVVLCSWLHRPVPTRSLHFPYKKAGLTQREAAERLLDRFTYGAAPGDIDAVMQQGLENWFEQQLNASLQDDSLNFRLTNYDAINLTNREVCHEYPPGFVIRSQAIKDSAISKDSVDKAIDKKAFNAQLQAYMEKKGFKSDQDLYKQFIDQNILRAVYTHNQLQEVVSDFWFNHFNVSFFKGECAQFIPAYERDVIRPNALGKFDQLLLASAKSPAMLYYLDNVTSVGPPPAAPAPKAPPKPAAAASTDMTMMMNSEATTAQKTVKTLTPPAKKNVAGLNENYAREVMELHTLGVDGGYKQEDVTQAARVLTGWTVYPISEYAYGSNMKDLVAKIGENNLAQKGYVHEGDFLFTPNRHDQGEKIVLGHHFPASTNPAAGYQEGVDLLEMLAHHPSTAKFICRKLAVRFVSDNPPQSLIDKMAKAFTSSDGDIKQVLITMVGSKEFWDKKALKVKSPYELAISSLRAMNADISDPYPLFNWISRMGQKIYYYQAPTGFPDRGQYWINTGSLLGRMDFSLALTSGQIAGVRLNWNTLMSGQPADNPQSVIAAYSKILLPDENPDEMVRTLSPLLNDPALVAKMKTTVQAPKPAPPPAAEKPMVGAPGDMALMSAVTESKPKPTDHPTPPPATDNKPNTMTVLAAAIIIGSPEFQQR